MPSPHATAIEAPLQPVVQPRSAMDPITFGLMMAVGAGGTAAIARWRRRRASVAIDAVTVRPKSSRDDKPRDVKEGLTGRREGAGSDLRVGDVLLHLGDEYWLSGELALVRDGSVSLRLFSAPERGKERWVAIPRAGDVMYVLRADDALAELGWPGMEVPLGGMILRPLEQGSCAVAPLGEVSTTWEGVGRYGVFRAMETVAVVVEQGGQRLSLSGKIIPRRLIEKLG